LPTLEEKDDRKDEDDEEDEIETKIDI